MVAAVVVAAVTKALVVMAVTTVQVVRCD